MNRSERWVRPVAWTTGIVTIALMLGALLFLFLDRHASLPPEQPAWTLPNVLDSLVNLGVPVIGILLATRRPENRIGWLFLVAGLALGLGTFADTYATHALHTDPGSLPAGRAFAWIANSIWPIPIGSLPFLLLWFPTGRLRSHRWRPVSWFATVDVAVALAASLIAATAVWSHPFTNELGAVGDLVDAAFEAALLGLPVAMLAAFVAVAVRFVGSRGEERLQLKWFAAAAALLAASFSLATVLSDETWLSFLTTLALLFLYVSIGIAVLRYRLYEIDVVIGRAVVFAALGAFITLVYVALVVGVGTLVGDRESPVLSALAAALVALAFQPVRQRARRLANRVVYGRRATPYEVLSDFSARAADTYSTEDVLPRMVQILAEGVGATRARVWLRVGSELRPAASWPAGAAVDPVATDGRELPAFPEGERAFAVRHGGELLGAITVTARASEPLGPDRERLVTDVAAQTALVLRNVRLIEELRESRRRIVAAQDVRAKALERNLHDGAQQQLVALAVKQRIAEGVVERDPATAKRMLGEIQAETQEALETLRDLARGIYPPLLADQGLPAALSAQARKAPLPVEVVADGVGRYQQEHEAAVYFCCLEALQNVAKYADAGRATVRLSAGEGRLAFEVVDDGVGFDTASTALGSGLQGMADRLDAIGGSLEVRSDPGVGTTVVGRVPVPAGDRS